MEPILLKPAVKDYLWGGSRLKNEYHKSTPLQKAAETWECSVHPDGESEAVSGPFAGKKLSSILREHPEYLGTKVTGGELPILVKFIDAEQDLSIQVHPDDSYALEKEGQNGKTEMWYILDAKPGAKLVCGFAHDVSAEQLRRDAGSRRLMKHLRWVPVHPGDVFYIPAGTVHAVGAGILLAEVQESSNVTYRIWDYDRVGSDGKKRAVHLDRAIEVLNMKSGEIVRQKPRKVEYFPGSAKEILCRCRYFETERYQISRTAELSVNSASFQVLLCIKGQGVLENGESRTGFRKGDCIFLPAGCGDCRLTGKTELLKIRC